MNSQRPATNVTSIRRLVGVLFFFTLISLSPWVLAEEDDDVMGDGLGESFGNVVGGSWHESELSIPARPEKDHLLPFKVFETPQYKYYLDTAALNVSAGDNVARYTVVIETPSGIKNIFYEGIRCDTQEYKMYASALWGSDLSPISEPQWSAVMQNGMGVYRYDLYQYYFCNNSIIRGSKKEILQMIEYPPDNFIDEELE